jgi:hypothetical protein
MKERPILFSGPMVRAILEGRKTQTRRVVNIDIDPKVGRFLEADPSGFWGFANDDHFPIQCIHCPYGIKGDRLWVRETWTPVSTYEPSAETGALYKADFIGSEDFVDWRWKPSIHMPRWASRITLEITGLRVERLQEISEADAIAEGIQHRTMNNPIVEFQWLWESISGPGSWAMNPWVWVLEFERGGDA